MDQERAQKNKGKLFVFEGVDGTGKETQLNLFKKHLLSEGLRFKFNSFPRYNKPSSYFINRYLDDLESPYGESDNIGPYMASLFYSLDRADASFGLKRWLYNNDVVVLDRYTGSNVGHQGAKLADKEERKKYTDWLFNLEYEILEIPRPDLNIVLDNPMDVIKRRLTERQNSDAHEANFDHIQKARESYLWAAENYDNFKIVSGVEDNRELTPEEIHERVWELTKSSLGL
ncbi:MAG: deoxynucleoside kinase [Candidatus Colwellbacteria bacterium]|nr:deoxynucleoside kinase [Candidatus Colwellbacteria bacterium]